MSNIKCSVQHDVLVVGFRIKNLSRIEEVTATGSQLLAMTCQATDHRMLLDFSGVEFLNSSMVGQLFVLSKRCRNDGITLRACNLNPTIRQVLEIVGLHGLIRIVGDDEDAFKSFDASDSDDSALETIELADVETLTQRADAGEADAMVDLAECYENGINAPQDMDQAFHWYRKAADSGHASGQYKTGVSYAYGIGVDPDWSLAMDWYRLAAEQGHAESEYAVGMIHCYGLAGQADKSKAAQWYKRSLSNGYERAELELSRLE